MTLPSMINASRSAKTRQVVFGGYNHIEGAGDGAIWDMGNMSSDHYPILAPRSKRKTLATLAAPHGICGGDKLAWVDGTVLYYDRLPKGTVAGSDKDMVTMGAYLTIWPDKKYYNIAKTLTYISGAGEISFGTATIVTTGEDFAYDAGDTVRISGCATQTGNNKDAVILSMSPDKKTLTFEAATFTAGSENGAITLDRIDFGDLESTYVSGAGEIKFGDDSLYNAAAEANAITTTGDAFDLNVGDAVRISGATLTDNNSPNIIPIIREVSLDKKTLRFYENVFDIGNSTTYEDKTLPNNVEDLSSVALYMGTTYSFAAGAYTVNQSTSIALSSAGATAALNKYYVSHETSSGSHNGSRMWQVVAANYADGMLQFVVIEHYAARYYTDPAAVTIERRVPDLKHVIEHENRLWGVDESDETIRCCKLGNPFVWDDFEGLADGCWQATVGSPGDFTGAASYGSYPTLWKGLDMYEIYGYMPSNFQAIRAARMGVAAGCSKSLAVAGETLFYMSREGPMAYAGGLPVSIAEPFGAVGYGNAVAGSDGKKYYVSMSDGTDYHLFVFDTQRKVWHREDGLQVIGWAYADDLYALTAGGDIVAVDPHHAVGTEETEVDWYVEFGDFTADSPNKKGIIKYQLSLYVATGASVTVKASYDGGVYSTVKTLGPGARRTEKIPIIPRRCDYYRLKIEGSGEAKIYALTQEQYVGSDD